MDGPPSSLSSVFWLLGIHTDEAGFSGKIHETGQNSGYICEYLGNYYYRDFVHFWHESAKQPNNHTVHSRIQQIPFHLSKNSSDDAAGFSIFQFFAFFKDF